MSSSDDNVEESSLYDVLNVSETATAEEIKRSYFRLIRKFRPDEHTEAFNKFKNAYDILSDPQKRKEYDQMREYGAEVKKLTDEAGEVIDEDPQRAIRLLKQAAILAPNLSMPRLLLGAAFQKIGDLASSEVELRRLTEGDPEDAFLRYQLGRCLWLQDKNTEAQHQVERAITIKPEYHDAYLLLSRIHKENGEIERAIQYLEQAIQLNSSEDFTDLEVLMLLLTIYVLENRQADIDQTMRRIYAVIPDDPDAVHYTLAHLQNLAINFYKAQNYSSSYEVIRRTYHPKQSDTELIEEIRNMRSAVAVLADVERLLSEEWLPKPLRAFFYFKHIHDFEEDEEKHDPEIVLKNVLAELSTVVPQNAPIYQQALTRIRNTYPVLAAEEERFLDVLKDAINDARHPSSRYVINSSGYSSSTGGSGCAVLVVALVGSAALLVACGHFLAAFSF